MGEHEVGRRAVFLVGGNDKVSPRLSDRNDVWGFAPVTKVLPRCSAVVHAGGHGTTAAALAAGVPSVVVPMLFDQQWHARRAEALGVGAYVPLGRAFATRLERALTSVERPEVRAAARSMQTRLSSENGPRTAVDKIESVLR